MSERIGPLDASISIGDGEKDAPGDDESLLRSQSLFSTTSNDNSIASQSSGDAENDARADETLRNRTPAAKETQTSEESFATPGSQTFRWSDSLATPPVNWESVRTPIQPEPMNDTTIESESRLSSISPLPVDIDDFLFGPSAKKPAIISRPFVQETLEEDSLTDSTLLAMMTEADEDLVLPKGTSTPLVSDKFKAAVKKSVELKSFAYPTSSQINGGAGKENCDGSPALFVKRQATFRPPRRENSLGNSLELSSGGCTLSSKESRDIKEREDSLRSSLSGGASLEESRVLRRARRTGLGRKRLTFDDVNATIGQDSGCDVSMSTSGEDTSVVQPSLGYRVGLRRKRISSKVSEENEAREAKVVKTGFSSKISVSHETMTTAKTLIGCDKLTAGTGFATASGQAISVSRESITRAKWLLEESSDVVEVKKKGVGFATASGKTISVSKDALAKAKKLLMESEEDKAKGNTAFSTASGKTISVSDEAMDRAKSLIESESNGVNSSTVNLSDTEARELAEACVADDENDVETLPESRREIEESLQAMLREDEAGISLTESNSKDETTSSSFRGFSTASGKTVTVSDEAIEAARRKLDDGDAACFSGDRDVPVMKSTSGFTGFQTASGRKVDDVSEESLERARRVLDDKGDDRIPSFNTASGRKVTFSEESLAKARSILHNSTTPSPVKSSPLFQTASGRKVDVSEDSLELVRLQERRVVEETSSDDRAKMVRRIVVAGPSSSNDRQRLSSPSISYPSAFKYDRRPKLGSSFGTPLLPQPFSRRHSTGGLAKRSCLAPFLSSPSAAPRSKAINRAATTTATSKVKSSSSFKTPYKVPENKTRAKQSAIKKQPVCTVVTASTPESVVQPTKSVPVKPLAGSLLSKRLSNRRFSILDLTKGQPPGHYTRAELLSSGVHPTVLSVSSSSAVAFRFPGDAFFSRAVCSDKQVVRLTDGGLLKLGDDRKAGIEEFIKTFYTTPGVDSSLIDDAWIRNHYRWIVWKLAAMEVAFPEHFAARLLAPDRVALELKYRYDREVDRSERSCLRKIAERDDVPSKPLVLCISAIHRDKLEKALERSPTSTTSDDAHVVELTDGWYGIPAEFDAPLLTMIKAGSIGVGTKLCAYGAELRGLGDACPPLELPSTARLKLAANSTRRALWYARLGYLSSTRAFDLPIGSLYGNGGLVGCVDVVIQRRYPLQWVERLDDGSRVFRGARAEDKVARRHYDAKQKRLDVLYARVRSQLEKEWATEEESVKRQSAKRTQKYRLSQLDCGETIHEALLSAPDPTGFEAMLSMSQQRLIDNYRLKREEEKRAEVERFLGRAVSEGAENIKDRDVSTMLRLRVSCCHRDSDQALTALLSVWRPTTELVESLAEGKRFKIYNLMASPARQSQLKAFIFLTATRRTIYREQKDYFKEEFSPRTLVSLADLRAYGKSALPAFKEFDTVGMVLFSCVTGGMQKRDGVTLKPFETVFITDSFNHLMAIRFWGTIEELALENFLKPRAVVSFSNLSWSGPSFLGNSNISFAFANELAVVSHSPKEPALQEAMENLRKSLPRDLNQYVENLTRSIRVVLTGTQKENVDVSPGVGNCIENDGKRKGLAYLNSIPLPPPLAPFPVEKNSTACRDFRKPSVLREN